jgi:hypothetical protein
LENFKEINRILTKNFLRKNNAKTQRASKKLLNVMRQMQSQTMFQQPLQVIPGAVKMQQRAKSQIKII